MTAQLKHVFFLFPPGPSVKELPENRSGRRRTNRLLFSRQYAGFHQRLGVGGPEQNLKEQLTTGNLKLEGLFVTSCLLTSGVGQSLDPGNL